MPKGKKGKGKGGIGMFQACSLVDASEEKSSMFGKLGSMMGGLFGGGMSAPAPESMAAPSWESECAPSYDGLQFRCNSRSVRRGGSPPKPKQGRANAARVSRGSEVDVWG